MYYYMLVGIRKAHGCILRHLCFWLNQRYAFYTHRMLPYQYKPHSFSYKMCVQFFDLLFKIHFIQNPLSLLKPINLETCIFSSFFCFVLFYLVLYREYMFCSHFWIQLVIFYFWLLLYLPCPFLNKR